MPSSARRAASSFMLIAPWGGVTSAWCRDTPVGLITGSSERMKIVTPKGLLMLALLIATAGFVLCVVVAVFFFVGLAEMFAPVSLVLFVGLFPLFYGAVRLLVRRTKGQMVKDWALVLFSGIPQWFSISHRVYFVLIWAGGLAALILNVVRGQRNWIGLLFVLVPSVFYLTCVGAYWSAIREMENDGGRAAPDSKDSAAEA